MRLATMAAAAFWELALPLPDDAAEGFTNFLWELGALGVVEEHAADGGARLRGFFAGETPAAALETRINDYLASLRQLGFAAAGAARLVPLEDGRWAEAWREHFRPLRVGQRLLVVPPWEAPSAGDRLTIIIDPGRAFGTGHHGSTAGCLERLEAIAAEAPPAAAIDLGTGSGILAIAAARLGVERVLAVDDDPDAVAGAAANAALNGVGDRMTCLRADAGAIEASAPLVLANLLAAAHARLAPAYRRLVLPGGRLVLGGILDGEAATVAAALRAHDFAEAATLSVDGWTTLELTGHATLHAHA
ncbi:MAG: 50S ribosomal protein L11 methyltransferase [Candidatus Rokubacteria bacterium]|nr:50S ribosomal protein L11 methyltransferase [Candidatus Rokubacteria bacterium]